MARKGTRQLSQSGPGPASQAWQDAIVRARGEGGTGTERETVEPWAPEVWLEDDESSVDAAPAVAPSPSPGLRSRPRPAPAGGGSLRRPRRLAADIGAELSEAVGPSRAVRLHDRLVEATKAYERDRYRDALSTLKPLADLAPGSAAIRELLGLTRYRLGHWNEAIKELESFRAITGSVDQHPALADSYRATKRWRQVEELWDELRKASPNPELVAEGRIVAAGALADRGRAAEAIALLEKARTDLRRPKDHHLRIWYALGDLYERAGELSRAREMFRRVLDFDADLYDTAERLATIG